MVTWTEQVSPDRYLNCLDFDRGKVQNSRDRNKKTVTQSQEWMTFKSCIKHWLHHWDQLVSNIKILRNNFLLLWRCRILHLPETIPWVWHELVLATTTTYSNLVSVHTRLTRRSACLWRFDTLVSYGLCGCMFGLLVCSSMFRDQHSCRVGNIKTLLDINNSQWWLVTLTVIFNNLLTFFKKSIIVINIDKHMYRMHHSYTHK